MKLKDFLDKFKHKDKVGSQIIVQQSPILDEKEIDIEISQGNNFTKVVIADYYELKDYMNKMKEIDNLGVEELLTTNLLWNGSKQLINKGTFYVFSHNGRRYNILINDEALEIDERTPIGEEIADKVITFYLDGRPYSYFRCMHDKNRSSYATRYYSPNGVPFLELPKEEFVSDFQDILSNLESFQGIDNIIDLNSMKNQIEHSPYEDILSK